MPAAALFAVLLAWPAFAAEDASFDPDRYLESTPAAIVKAKPCRPGPEGFEVKDVLFSLRAEYRPVTRALPKEHAAPLRRWTAKLRASDQAERFTKEIRLGRGADAAWAATTEEVLGALRRDLKPGETAWFYLSFIGCVGEAPAFALDEFQTDDDVVDEEPASVVI